MGFWHNHWHWILGTLAFTLSVITSSHAIVRRRDPRAALWWTGVAWVMPFFGSLLYYFFGINRIERKAARLRRRRTRTSPSPVHHYVRESEQEDVSPEVKHLSSLARLVGSVVHMPLTDGNTVTLLENGDEAYPAMLQAIDEAKRSVALCTYIFNNDRVGAQFVEALARAVKRGLQVRVLIDDVGSGFAWKSICRALTERQVPVAYFNPTLVPWRAVYMNLRDHRKILVADGRVAFTGSMNISEGHQLSLSSASPCQDIHFRLEGPVVAQIQDTFRTDWHFSTNEALDGETWFPPLENKGEILARGIADGPDEDFEKCRWTILGALAHARKSIRIMTPYFVPDSGLITALNVAALSGIRVDIVLTDHNDLILVDWAARAMLWQVLARGCRVWRTPPPFNHAKLMVIDGGWTLFGSTNWDSRSLRLNFEFNVECYDDELAVKMEHLIDAKIATARQVTLAEVDARPLPIKLRDGIARLFSPHL
jgi:cardiolipin synthase